MREGAAEHLASVYLAFSEREARGRSPLYEELARRVSTDSQLLTFLAHFPPPKQQPNLLFAAVKYLFGAPETWDQFRGLVLDHRNEIADVITARSTQTNEPARCATLMPLFATLPQPLALVEVGAAAGLCLLPDMYAYEYDGHFMPPTLSVGADPPTFSCDTNLKTPIPARGVEVVWRVGLDLAPIDITDEDQVAWLEALVWPGEGRRLDLLRAALAIARQDHPRIVQGDLREDLPDVLADAPKDATLVVFHTSVLCYVPGLEDKQSFARLVGDIAAAWISNEGPGVLPWVAEKIDKPWPIGQLLLSLNEQPVAWTDPHGTSIEWLL